MPWLPNRAAREGFPDIDLNDSSLAAQSFRT
jgi:hypothetical protein